MCSSDLVTIGISGWTGFAPLTLAKEAGIFKKHGLDVTIKKIPQKDRHLAIAAGDVQCAATTVETWVVWNANGVATVSVYLTDDGGTANGIAVGDNFAVRRTYRVNDAPRRFSVEHTAGLLQIVSAEERESLAVVVYACDAVMRGDELAAFKPEPPDRKSTRLNSSHRT